MTRNAWLIWDFNHQACQAFLKQLPVCLRPLPPLESLQFRQASANSEMPVYTKNEKTDFAREGF